ncbi:ABC transporter substrate-binding protein [Sphingomonas sp. KC8]|nr:ABC transporter substrate-binding protein [Sphingomonas sp. KC8]
MMKRQIAIALFLATAGCSGSGGHDGPLDVSVIGDPPAIVDPSQKTLRTGDAALVAATAQGLIRFDASGQIEPGVAIRWDVSDDGLYYTFRIDGESGFDAAGVARRLREMIGRTSNNPLKPMLGAIDEIIAVTPEVVEIRLTAPRPNFLQLLAQPEMALIKSRSTGGSGPLKIDGRGPGWLLLGPLSIDNDEEPNPADIARQQVRLRGDRAAMAVVRFREGTAQAVLGGRFQDLAIARAAQMPANTLRFDPVSGLFGLAVSDTSGFLGSAENRRALSMAIDRDRLVATFAVKGWRPAVTIAPAGMADLPAPATPDWVDTPLQQRRAIAVNALATGAPPARIRVAMPEGPGARLLFAFLRSGWASIGVDAVAVGPRDKADLRLIDQVAPADTGAWYLRQFQCNRAPVCSETVDALLEQARTAATLPERNLALAEADARLVQITPFIPLAMPLRWSLVTSTLNNFKENPRGAHPLNHLRRGKR